MQLSQGAEYVLKRLEQEGFSGWLVGGCVRDSLIGIPAHDYDIATDAPPQTVMRCFERDGAIPTGIKHGTVTVLHGGEQLEVTTLRADGEYTDGRRPTAVTFVNSPEQDLARRDFTINAMAWSVGGGLCDPFGGAEDLRQGLVRCVGSPEKRFSEDKLRILRALRFSCCLDFEIEEQTVAGMLSMQNGLKEVSAERKWAELKKLLCAKAVSNRLPPFACILQVIINRNIPIVSKNVEMLPLLPQEAVLRLSALLPTGHDVGAAVAKQLRLSRRERTRLSEICELRQLIETLPLRQQAERLTVIDGCHHPAQLAIGGSELLQHGYPGGESLGLLQRRLLKAVAAGNVANKKDELIAFAKDM